MTRNLDGSRTLIPLLTHCLCYLTRKRYIGMPPLIIPAAREGNWLQPRVEFFVSVIVFLFLEEVFEKEGAFA